MLKFKAILVKREKEYFIYFNDSETILEGTNKFKLLRRWNYKWNKKKRGFI